MDGQLIETRHRQHFDDRFWRENPPKLADDRSAEFFLLFTEARGMPPSTTIREYLRHAVKACAM